MAWPIWGNAAVAGGAGLGGTGIAAATNARQNKKNKEFAMQQYSTELGDQYGWQGWRDNREDDVWMRQNKYNEDRWRIQNEYDSPAAQMQRFKDAGLNPNLIYGQMGNGGNISTAQTGSSGGSVPHASWQGKAYDASSGISGSIQSMFDAYQQQITTDNLKKAGQLADEEIALRSQQKLQTAAQTDNILANTETSKYNLGYQQSIRDLSTQALQESNRNLRITGDVALQANERAKAENASNLREAAERILNMRGQRVNATLDSQLKQMDIQLKSMGVQPGDALFFRVLGRALNAASNTDMGRAVREMADGSLDLSMPYPKK